jgi:hypothetical protein
MNYSVISENDRSCCASVNVALFAFENISYEVDNIEDCHNMVITLIIVSKFSLVGMQLPEKLGEFRRVERRPSLVSNPFRNV